MILNLRQPERFQDHYELEEPQEHNETYTGLGSPDDASQSITKGHAITSRAQSLKRPPASGMKFVTQKSYKDYAPEEEPMAVDGPLGDNLGVQFSKARLMLKQPSHNHFEERKIEDGTGGGGGGGGSDIKIGKQSQQDLMAALKKFNKKQSNDITAEYRLREKQRREGKLEYFDSKKK